MRILVFETNLIWSSRLVQSLKNLGHEPLLLSVIPVAAESDAAIVNLGDPKLDAKELIKRLHDLGIPVIAHAGHKEKNLIALGQEAGADVLATNGQLTYKLEALIEQVKMLDRVASSRSGTNSA